MKNKDYDKDFYEDLYLRLCDECFDDINAYPQVLTQKAEYGEKHHGEILIKEAKYQKERLQQLLRKRVLLKDRLLKRSLVRLKHRLKFINRKSFAALSYYIRLQNYTLPDRLCSVHYFNVLLAHAFFALVRRKRKKPKDYKTEVFKDCNIFTKKWYLTYPFKKWWLEDYDR